MPDQFILKKDTTVVRYSVNVSTIGNASTVPRLKNPAGEVTKLKASPPKQNGSIPKRDLDESNKLAGYSFSFDTAILLDNVLTDPQIDQAFQNLAITYTLYNGRDGDQDFLLAPDEKLLFKESKLIVAAKSIKLVTHK